MSGVEGGAMVETPSAAIAAVMRDASDAADARRILEARLR
jgi:hypothetical protein